jgi:hypothetical protein
VLWEILDTVPGHPAVLSEISDSVNPCELHERLIQILIATMA